MIDYLCRVLHALAVQAGCEVPAWDNRYLNDYHALSAIRDAGGPLLEEVEEGDA